MPCLVLQCRKFPRYLKLCIQETQPHNPTTVVNHYYEVGWLTQSIDYHLPIKIAIYKLQKICHAGFRTNSSPRKYANRFSYQVARYNFKLQLCYRLLKQSALSLNLMFLGTSLICAICRFSFSSIICANI